MATGLHNAFMSKVSHKITTFFEEHSSSSDRVIAKIASHIMAMGPVKICRSGTEYSGKRPDESFQLILDTEDAVPGLVAEVAWTQDKSELKGKAKYYFDNTEAKIRTVVVFNLNDIYKKQVAVEKRWSAQNKKWENGKLDQNSPPEPPTFLVPTADAECADFSVWRAKFNSRTEKSHITNKSVENQVRLSSFVTILPYLLVSHVKLLSYTGFPNRRPTVQPGR